MNRLRSWDILISPVKKLLWRDYLLTRFVVNLCNYFTMLSKTFYFSATLAHLSERKRLLNQKRKCHISGWYLCFLFQHWATYSSLCRPSSNYSIEQEPSRLGGRLLGCRKCMFRSLHECVLYGHRKVHIQILLSHVYVCVLESSTADKGSWVQENSFYKICVTLI